MSVAGVALYNYVKMLRNFREAKRSHSLTEEERAGLLDEPAAHELQEYEMLLSPQRQASRERSTVKSAPVVTNMVTTEPSERSQASEPQSGGGTVTTATRDRQD